MFKANSLLGSRALAVVVWWAATLGFLVIALWLVVRGQGNVVAASIVFVLLLVATLVSKPASIPVILGFLFILGDLRRVFGAALGFPTLDPMLLVGPAISFVLALPILMRLRLADGISKLLFSLMVVMTLEIFNPKQGSPFVGFTGAMFYLVPLLWFWIGREFGTPELLRTVIFRVMIPLALLAAAMGVTQIYFGFLPWQTAWVEAVSTHYHALYLASGVVRSFGFSVNSAEYAALLLMASVASLAAFFAGRRVYIFFVPPLVTALFLSASRSSMFKLLFAVAISWALCSKGGRGWTVRLVFALAVGFGGLAFSLSQFVPEEATTTVVIHSKGHGKGGDEDAASAATQHQLQGLAHPLDKKYSTAQGHSTLFLGGILEGIKNPVGSGLGAVTLGNGKFGGDAEAAGSTEVDISDAFVSCGLVGGILYLCIIFMVILKSVTFSRIAPKQVGLPVIGILAAMLGSWIALGQYAIGPVIWLIVGTLSRYAIQQRPFRANRVA